MTDTTTAPMTQSERRDMWFSGIGEHVAQEVAEISDRQSPDDQPEMMLVTTDELIAIVDGVIAARFLAEIRQYQPETAMIAASKEKDGE